MKKLKGSKRKNNKKLQILKCLYLRNTLDISKESKYMENDSEFNWLIKNYYIHQYNKSDTYYVSKTGEDILSKAYPKLWKSIRSRFACVDCDLDVRDEKFYMIMIEDNLWANISNDKPNIILCQNCIEKRLGRELECRDLRYTDQDTSLTCEIECSSDEKYCSYCNMGSLKRMGRIKLLKEYINNSSDPDFYK